MTTSAHSTDNFTTQILTTHPSQLQTLQPDNDKHAQATIKNIQRNSHSRHYPTKPIRVHVDGGANRSITNDLTLLTAFRNIKRYAINGVADQGPAVICTGMGYLPWRATSGETLYIKCYYSNNAADTIVSPTDAVIHHMSAFHAWGQYCDLDTGRGYIQFHRRDEQPPLTYDLTANNGLWYHDGTRCIIEDYSRELYDTQPLVQRLTQPAQYELFHQRFGHPGQRTMSELHKYVDDVPILRGNAFYKCASCMHAKCKQRAHNHSRPNTTNNDDPKEQDHLTKDHLEDPILENGQRYYMDFGFMKGSGYCHKDEEGRTITSIDGYRSYLLIIDEASRYTWIFLTKTKAPPLEILQQFFEQHGNRNLPNRIVRTDEGGELWASTKFKETVMNAGYIMEPTAPGAPFQNGLAEQPNQTFGTMVRCLLHSANLCPEYWSYALVHAVYLKNRLPHTAIRDTPFHKYTGQRPTAKFLRVFGCPVIVKNPGRRSAKLDMHTVQEDS